MTTYFPDHKANRREPHSITFYTKEGCCLCDEAREMLATLATEFTLSITEVDITLDPDAYERFKYAIPVVEIDDLNRIGGRLSLYDLRCAIMETEGRVMEEVDKTPPGKLPARQSQVRRKARGAVTTTVQLLAAILLVGAVFWILAERGVLPLSLERADGAIPRSIAGYQLQKTITGQGAIDQLTGMHGKDVELSSGWIGYYQAGGIVWYADIESEAKAAELIARMSSKIAQGNPTFTNQRQRQLDGTTVFSVIGTGQQHFYYRTGKKAIWLAAPRGGEEPFLRDTMRVLK